jgi:hypothetical protein
MDTMIESLADAMEAAISKLRSYPSREISLFHHNDTDGISSGAILSRAFEREGYRLGRYAIEKPYPRLLDRIFEESGRIIVFTDLAGKIAPLISGLNRGRNLVLIIDHHPAEASGDSMVHNLDGDLHGLKGDRDISASATCFLFARTMNRAIEELSHLGALGAIGDGFLVDGALSGYNRQVMLEAVDKKLIHLEKSGSGEEYGIELNGRRDSAGLCTILDTLGGVGYYDGAADRGVRFCLGGLVPGIEKEAADLLKKRDELFLHEVERLRRGGLKTTEHLQWFDVRDRFRPMGVKMIGVFCNLIRNTDLTDHRRYLAGFQSVPDEVPGFGPMEFRSKKISMRVSDYLTEEIRAGRKPGLNAFLPEAALKIGGFADACHSLSAAVTVSVGDEERLIREIERVLHSF